MPNKAKNAKKKQSQNKPKPKGAGMFKQIGKLAGGIISPGFSRLGGVLGSTIDRITGHGDYQLRGNTLMSGQAPSFMSNDRGMRICHREYVCDVVSTTGFRNEQFFINPGNARLFRWLSAVATSFESYEFHGLTFSYTTRSGTALSSVSAAMGAVIMSTEYDVLKEPFSSKQDAEAYAYTTADAPYKPMIHGVECKPSLTVLPRKFTTYAQTPTELASDDDPRLHYQGNFQLMTQGQQSTGSTLGELWVSYDITLYTPRPEPTRANLEFALLPVEWGTNPAPATGVQLYTGISMHRGTWSWAVHGGGTGCVKFTFSEPGDYIVTRGVMRDALETPQLVEATGYTFDGGADIVAINMTSTTIDDPTTNPFLTYIQEFAIDVAGNRASTHSLGVRVYKSGTSVLFPSVQFSAAQTEARGADTYRVTFVQYGGTSVLQSRANPIKGTRQTIAPLPSANTIQQESSSKDEEETPGQPDLLRQTTDLQEIERLKRELEIAKANSITSTASSSSSSISRLRNAYF